MHAFVRCFNTARRNTTLYTLEDAGSTVNEKSDDIIVISSFFFLIYHEHSIQMNHYINDHLLTIESIT